MGTGARIGIFVVVAAVAGAGAGVRAYFRMLDVAKERQVVAKAALMASEKLVWTLEGECLKDAVRILSEPNAKKIATTAEGVEGGAEKVESRLREYLRVRRGEEVWKAAEKAFITLTPDSRKATNEAAVKAGLRPVDILAEWFTCDGATDLYLMAKVARERKALKEKLGAVVDTFFPEGAEPPSAEKGVKVVEQTDERIVVDLFGGKVVEECLPGPVTITGDDKATVRWKSNYNFLKAHVTGKKAEPETEDTLVKSDDGFGVDYTKDVAEFLEGAGKKPWATVLCTKGVAALGEFLNGKDEKTDDKKDEKK
jgi:hypothetical protein